MNRLIQDFLDVARMEAGRLHVEPCRTQAVQIASNAVETHRPLASSASVDLRLDLAQDLPDVWVDCDRLLQVFENLIGNAVKFTGSGGRITVGAAAQGPEVLFWVADTGFGIAVEDQAHLFDQFWQARKDHRHHGVGLGLPIVKGIVQAHGGRVWVESTLGCGSTFFFTIPTATRGEEERPKPAVHRCSASVHAGLTLPRARSIGLPRNSARASRNAVSCHGVARRDRRMSHAFWMSHAFSRWHMR